MNRSTAKWIESTIQCRHCSARVTHVENDFLCTPCHQLQALFPQGQSFRQRRHYDFITKSMISSIPPLYATEHIPAAQKMIYAHYFIASCDWYVAELDPSTGDAFGYADLGCGEWGSFNLVELESLLVHKFMVIDRELDFTPISAADIGIA
jgi:hypothetical protein